MTGPHGDERSREEPAIAARREQPQRDERLREEVSRRERSELASERSEWPVVSAPPAGARESIGGAIRSDWPLFEVFLRGKRGLNHVHVGSLHASDATMALRHARDLYTRRNEGVSIWVVNAADITASSPDEKDPFFAPSGDKVYRHPTFYAIPDDVPHM
jgi:ring-1,2-phenylacetyl-CoA epoxidase subunit PaaB